MTRFILWYEKLPTYDSYVEKLSTKFKMSKQAAHGIFSIFMLTILAAYIWLPSLLGTLSIASYWVMLSVYLICTASFLWAMLTVATLWSPKLRDWISIFSVISVMTSIFAITPINYQSGANTKYVQDTTYITYDMKCPYCKKAHSQMIAATNLYNQTHKKQIKIVDIRKDTELAKTLKTKINYKGTIIDTKTGKQSTYTLKNAKNDPDVPSIGYVWEILRSYSH